MDRLARITKEQLIAQMRAEFERTMAQVTEAVNDAKDGHLIDDSEERCRDVLGEFRRRAYERALQLRVEATEADPSFSPSSSAAGASRAGQPHGAELLRSGPDPSPSLREPRRRNRRARG